MRNCSYSPCYCLPQKHTTTSFTSSLSPSNRRQILHFTTEMPIGIDQNKICFYLFHAAPGLLCRRERHENTKDIRSCCFTATNTTTYLLSYSSTALQGLPPGFEFKLNPSKVRYLSLASSAIPLDGRNMQYPGEDFSRWRQVLCLLPSRQDFSLVPTPTHSQHLVQLLTIAVPPARQPSFSQSDKQLNCQFLLMFSTFPPISSDEKCGSITSPHSSGVPQLTAPGRANRCLKPSIHPESPSRVNNIKTTASVQDQLGNKARDQAGNRHTPSVTQRKTNEGFPKPDQVSSVFLHVIK